VTRSESEYTPPGKKRPTGPRMRNSGTARGLRPKKVPRPSARRIQAVYEAAAQARKDQV
jgi:hypothetical protein